ncbi:MAG: flavodoxin family protein [Desulfovibrio sp.]|jgi:multimeric flavodoxin WrbA|nr:flavodoxin family protein [Desulfovibrio sp.]
MKLLAINGSPRKKMNTGSLLEQIVKGAVSEGAEAELVHLADLTFTGCLSCFRCKDPKGKHYGRCAVKDDLAPVLRKAHKAEALVLGSPFYFSMETAFMRACMERLWFQYYLYTNKKQPLSPAKKATALVYTMNIREEELAAYGKDAVIARSKGLMERFFAPCEVFLCCDTRQVKNYSKYEFDVFDVPGKLKRHEDVFPQELARAFTLGSRLVS